MKFTGFNLFDNFLTNLYLNKLNGKIYSLARKHILNTPKGNVISYKAYLALSEIYEYLEKKHNFLSFDIMFNELDWDKNKKTVMKEYEKDIELLEELEKKAPSRLIRNVLEELHEKLYHEQYILDPAISFNDLSYDDSA